MITMKIYFAGAIRGGRDDKALYMQLIQELASYGTVLTEHVGSEHLTAAGEHRDDAFIYNRDMSWIEEADVIIAEVSTPSLGVGYEIAKAEDMQKQILCLHRQDAQRRLSAMINGNSRTRVVNYNTFEEAKEHLKQFFSSL